MLKIRPKQMQMFSEDCQRRHIDKLTKHFSSVYPPDNQKTWGHATGQELRQRILLGIDDAENYGFVTEVEQFKYLECIMELGDKFDKNAQYPWATAILNHKDGRNRIGRLSSLLDVQLTSQEGQ